MSPRRWSLLALAACGALVLWLSSRSGPGPAESGSPAATLQAPRVAWPKGLVRRYRVSLSGRSSMPGVNGAAPLEGSLLTEGELSLRGYGEEGGRVRVGLTLDRLGRNEMSLFGGAAMQDRAAVEAAMVGPEAVLTLFPTGDLDAIAFTPGAHHLFQAFAQTVAGELQAPLRAGEEWTLVDTTLRGRAEAHYARRPGGLSRTRVSYPVLTGFGRGLTQVKVAADASLELNDEGQVTSLHSAELLTGQAPTGSEASSRLELSLQPLGTTHFAGLLPAALEPARAGEAPRPADLKEQLLTQRVAGLTAGQLFESVHDFGASGALPGLGQFMGRGSGLLLQRPELCAELARRMTEPKVSARERTFALELLAAAGSPEAQAAMRELLSSQVMSDDAQRKEGYLRLALLQRPTLQTVEFVDQAFKTSTGGDRDALALALGATAGMLYRSGDAAHAEPFVAELSAALGSATTADERGAMLFALGNAGLESRQAEVARYLGDGDPDLRYAATVALRKLNTAEARAALAGALGDSDDRVNSRAVQILGEFSPNASERAAMMAAMRGGRIRFVSAHAVVSALEPFAQDLEVRAFLTWLQELQGVDPAVQRRIRTILETERVQ